MRNHSLLLAALVALATGACRTTTTAEVNDGPAASSASNSTSGLSSPHDSLHDRVHDALMEKMGPRVNDVGVKTDGSKVILTGSVRTASDKKQAHDIAHGVRGVTAVDDSALVVRP